MLNKDIVSMFVIAFLVFSVVFIALPEKGVSGILPVEIGCCQFSDACENLNQDTCLADSGNEGFFPGEVCVMDIGACTGSDVGVRPIPTLSEWGLIAMAGLLGIAGFIVIRKKYVAI